MAGGSEVARVGETVGKGLIAKAAKDVLRDAEGPVVKDAARSATSGAARDGEGAALRDAESRAERTAEQAGGKSAGKSARTGGKDLASAGRKQRIRNDSGLPRDASTAERRRAYDKANNTEPDWSKVTEGYHGPKPADMPRPHGHHIVFKQGRPGPMQDVLQESKAILEKHGIDWYTGGENLIWATNQGHSLANAKAVRDLLKAADGDGPAAVRAALRTAGRTIFGGKP